LKSYPGMLTLLVCHTITDPMRILLVFKKIILVIFDPGYQRWKFCSFRLFGQGYQWWKFLFFFVIFGKGYKQWSFCFFLVIFGQGYQRWKLCFFLVIFSKGCQRWKFCFSLSILAKDTNGESFGWSWSFLARLPMVKVLVGLGHVWPRMPMVKVFVFHWHFWPRLLLLATSVMNTNDESYVGDLRFWATSGIPLCQTWVRVRWRQSLAPHCASRSLRSGRQLLAWDCKYEYTRAPVGKRWHASMSISFLGMERVNKGIYFLKYFLSYGMFGKWRAKEKLFHILCSRQSHASHEHHELCIVS